ncbi:MAG: ABC transporter permease [Candidatus Nanopelagicales bacterium]
MSPDCYPGQPPGASAIGHADHVRYGSLTQTGFAIALLALITVGVMGFAGIRQRLDYLGAAARSIVQLILVALVVAWVFLHPAGTALYLVVMLVAATATSVRRIKCGWRNGWRVLTPLAFGAVVAVTPVIATGALPLTTQSVLPFTAQVIGGSMTAVSLTGTRFRDDAHSEWDVVEGWLAIGATPREAVAAIGRRAAERSLIPGLDQTRSAGLVVLPGAFVGMLLGGASPAQAAQVQLLVLIALLAATTCAAAGLVATMSPVYGLRRPASLEPEDKA